MVTTTVNPEPLQQDWEIDPSNGLSQRKEMLGRTSLFRRHCGTNMRLVLTFIRPAPHAEATRHYYGQSICPVCERRSWQSLSL